MSCFKFDGRDRRVIERERYRNRGERIQEKNDRNTNQKAKGCNRTPTKYSMGVSTFVVVHHIIIISYCTLEEVIHV